MLPMNRYEKTFRFQSMVVFRFEIAESGEQKALPHPSKLRVKRRRGRREEERIFICGNA